MDRLLPFALSFFLLVAAAQAQQQERKLMDRIMKPDQSLEYDVSQSSFGKPKSVTAKSAQTQKAFTFDQHVLAKPYHSQPFGDLKQAWMGNFKFDAKPARTRGDFALPNSGKAVETKTMPVAAARESSKSMDTTTYAAAHRSYFGRGKSQDQFDKEGPAAQASTQPLGYTGDLKPMTIDDVRELLNKNK